MEDKKKIKVTPNGPYLVSGDIKLSEKIIVKEDGEYCLKEGKTLAQKKVYALCRCGKSKTPPFCDGQHQHFHFDGSETASREFFDNRAEKLEGPELDLMDDHRCALARFCHRKAGSAWQLVKKTDDPLLKEEAVQAAMECPAGRLELREKDGTSLEKKLEPEIIILQDPEKNVSGGIYVKGGIEIISETGESYETRQRVVLCRCGESKNKPFCDAAHTHIQYRDEE